MGWDFCNQTTPQARKRYHCDASDWINNFGLEDVVCDCTDDEKAALKRAEQEGWKILPGTKYVKCSGVWEGDFSVFRARPELNAICLRLDLYDE